MEKTKKGKILRKHEFTHLAATRPALLAALAALFPAGAWAAGDDAGALLWLPPTDILPDRFGLASIRAGICKLLNR